MLLVVEDYVNLKALAHLLDLISRDIYITFLHVVEFPISTSIYPETVTPYLEEAKKRFDNLIDWAKSQGVNADLKVVASRSIIEAVLMEADRDEYDLIVLQKAVKKMRRRISELFHRTSLERLVDKSRHVIIILPTN